MAQYVGKNNEKMSSCLMGVEQFFYWWELSFILRIVAHCLFCTLMCCCSRFDGKHLFKILWVLLFIIYFVKCNISFEFVSCLFWFVLSFYIFLIFYLDSEIIITYLLIVCFDSFSNIYIVDFKYYKYLNSII